jgi:hypothetical protein
MEPIINLEPRDLLIILLVVIGVAMVLSALLAFFVIQRVRRIKLPPDADPITALLMTPLSVVILLDLLDLSMDFLSAPIAWTILSYLGLLPLRAAAVIVSVIPGTQFLPAMTLAWFIARIARSRLYPENQRIDRGRF